MRKHVIVCDDVNVNLLNTSHPQTILLSEYITNRDVLQPIVSPLPRSLTYFLCLLER